jgi:hypothetical protein
VKSEIRASFIRNSVTARKTSSRTFVGVAKPIKRSYAFQIPTYIITLRDYFYCSTEQLMLLTGFSF